MAARFFGHGGGLVHPAPPRHRLRMFGGDLAVDAFRTEHQFACSAMSPPFISTPQVYERIQVSADVPANRAAGKAGVTQPMGPAGLFSTFVRQKRAAPEEPRQADERRGVPGALSVFVKKRHV